MREDSSITLMMQSCELY